MEQSHTDGLATDSDHPLRMMIDHMPTLAWACRPDGTTAFLNQRWLDYTGLAMAQVLDWGWTAAIHPDDLGVSGCVKM
jgi:PAS domain-containing protein